MKIVAEVTRKIRNDRSSDTVYAAIEALVKIYTEFVGTHQCFLYCMEGRSTKFYSTLIETPGVKVLRVNCTGMKKFMSTISGLHQAVILVNDPTQIVGIFQRIAEQAMAGIYILSKNHAGLLEDYAKSDFSRFEELISADEYHLKYIIDEDANSEGDKILEILEFAKLCPAPLYEALNV